MSSRSHVPIPASILIKILLRKYAIEIRAPTRTALFTLILPGPPLRPFKGCQQILSHSFLFPAFAFQQAVKKIEAVPGILVCALQAVLRCTNIFQCELLNVDAKKSHGRSWRTRACSRRCFVRMRNAVPGMGHSHVSFTNSDAKFGHRGI